MTRLKINGVRWELAPDFAPRLAAVLASAGQPLKQSTVKTVTRHVVQDKTYYVKRYRHAAVPLRPLKFLFKRSQAHHEWRVAEQLQMRGVPVVCHVALGERWGASGLRESILITEGFDGEPLDKAPAVDGARVLAFVRRLHECGVLQRDLHPGNILVGGASQELRLVDVHGTVVKSRLSAAECRENLAFLRIFLPLPVSAEVLEVSRRLRRDYYHYYSKRCWKTNREFGRERMGKVRWHLRRPFVDDRVRRILRDPDRFLNETAELLKPGRSSTVGRANGVILKRANLRKWTSLVKDLFRRSRALRAYRKAYHLELLGIPTAPPIAAGERRSGGWPLRSYFVMREIPGATGLKAWPDRGGRVLRAVAGVVAQLHEEGFTHRDLKESNLVLDAAGRPHLVDLEGLRYIQDVPRDRAAADLARLAEDFPSGRLRWRFLTYYCRARGLTGVQREWASRITSHLDARR